MPGGPSIVTGHHSGTITLNVAEADDDERARRRIALGEPYRTLIGHLRHESGHFYWDQLVRDGGWLDDFRQRFGDERQDYAAALEAHYAKGNDGGDWANAQLASLRTKSPQALKVTFRQMREGAKMASFALWCMVISNHPILSMTNKAAKSVWWIGAHLCLLKPMSKASTSAIM